MTTYYAQNSSVNIDSANQWNTAADGSGSALTWASLGATDVLNANGKTAIAINVNFTCARIETDATLGGAFTITAGRTITCDITAGSSTCVTCSSGSGSNTFVGNITGGNAANVRGLYRATAAVAFTITGNVTGGSASGAAGLYNSSAGTVSITGDITAGSALNAYSINTSAGTITVTGNIINNASTHAVNGPIVYAPSATNYIQYPDTSATKNYYYDIPDVANLLTTDTAAGVSGTFNEADRNTDPGEENVEDGVTYKILNVSKEGTLVASGGGGVSKSRVFGGL